MLEKVAPHIKLQIRNICQWHMKPLCNVHDFNIAEIRKTVCNFYIVEKRIPTVLHLQVKFAMPINFNGGIYVSQKNSYVTGI
jgi:hypothetical protein